MFGDRDRATIPGGGSAVVVLVLATVVAGGIASATAALCPAADAADCRLADGGRAAVESVLEATSLGGSAGIVGAPRGNRPGGDGPPGRRGGDEGEGGDGGGENGGPDDRDSGEGDGAPGNGGDAPGRGVDASGDSGDEEGGDESDDSDGADSDAPGNSGDAPGRNGTTNAGGRGPPASVPAAVNLTARGKSGRGDETLVNASVGDVRRNQRVSVDLDARRAALLNRSNASDVAVTNIDLTPTRNGSFTMNLTTADRIDGSPAFESDDGSEALTHIRVDHSITNAEVNGTVGIGFEVSTARLANESVDPGDVALYRYENGSWTELPTELVDETEGAFRFRAESPGLSEFAAGAKRPRFTVETVDVAVAEIAVGDGVRVHVTVANDGGADGEFVAQLILDGRPVEERSLTIAAGGQRQTLFDHAVADAGEYEVRVNDVVAGSVVVRQSLAGESATEAGTAAVADPAVPTDSTAPPSASPTVTGTDVAGPLFHPTALVFVVAVALAARVRRR